MGFTTNYAVLVHHLKFQLECFPQTPQGTSFNELINDWVKTYGYGYKFTRFQFGQLITNFTIVGNKQRQAPGYNKADDIIDGRTAEVPLHPMLLRGQEMPKKGFFAGFESTPGINDYPPVETENRYHSTSSDKATIFTLVKSDVDQATESIDAPSKKQEVRGKKVTTQEQPCKNYGRAVHTYFHKDIKEEKLFQEYKQKGGRPPWATKKLNKINIVIKSD